MADVTERLMAADLLPCPWCGAPGATTIVDHLGARCTGCGAMGPMRDVDGVSVHMKPERARSAWNRRVATRAPTTGDRPSWICRLCGVNMSNEEARGITHRCATPPAAPVAVTSLLNEWDNLRGGDPIALGHRLHSLCGRLAFALAAASAAPKGS